jgi:hypothetical protein
VNVDDLVGQTVEKYVLSSGGCKGELSYLAPRGSEKISAPYFKQCFFRVCVWGGGGITTQAASNTKPPSPNTEITNILFHILNFASVIKYKMQLFFTILPQNKKQKPPLQIYRPRQLPSLPRPKFAPGWMNGWMDKWIGRETQGFSI